MFIIKLVKMWLGRAPHVVVGTLKICLDQYIFWSLVEPGTWSAGLGFNENMQFTVGAAML